LDVKTSQSCLHLQTSVTLLLTTPSALLLPTLPPSQCPLMMTWPCSKSLL
jgi:hypothetical protein